MIHALILLDESGSLIYHWKHKRAPEYIIKKFIPELIGSFASAIISFGAEILQAPRYIDMGIAGASIVNISIGDRVLTAFVIADPEDKPEAINRFVWRFKKDSEPLLSKILSFAETGAILIEETETKKLDELMEKTVKKETRWLPYIRSYKLRAFLFGFVIGIPLITVISSISFNIFSYITIELLGMTLEQTETYLTLFLLYWWIPNILSGILIGYMTSKSTSAFFAGLLGYVVFWLALTLGATVSPVAFLGGLLYSITVGIFAFVSGGYFDSKKLNAFY